MNPSPLLLAAVLAGSAPAVAQGRATGQFFTVVCDGGDDALADRALQVVEPVWPIACAAFGVEPVAPDEPLEVHLYREPAGYLAADRRLTGGQFQPNFAMSHWGSRTAHVAMQPPCSDAYLERFGLPLQTEAMLAWEACHVARYELCPNFRAHPGWFHDGLAAVTAQQVVRARHPDLTDAPFFTQRWLRVQHLLEGDRLPGLSALLGDETQGLEMRDRYAARIAFFEFARRERDAALREIAGKVRATTPGPRYAGRIGEAVERAFGGLDDAFRGEVANRSPGWDELVRSLWCFGDELRQHAFARQNAVAFCTRPVVGGGLELTGQVFVLPGPSQQMNVLFGRTDGGYLSLAIVPGTGVTLFERDLSDGWRVLGRGAHPELEAGRDLPFRLRAIGRDVSVRLAGRDWAFVLPDALPDRVTWGIGAQAAGDETIDVGSFGVWRDLRARAARR